MQQPSKTDLPLPAQRSSPHAYMQERHAIVAHAQKAMEAARQRMSAQADLHRQKLTVQVGDLISLKTKHLMVNTPPNKKLFPKWVGPMRVQRVVNPAAYMLELPKTPRAHNVLHVGLLKPSKPLILNPTLKKMGRLSTLYLSLSDWRVLTTILSLKPSRTSNPRLLSAMANSERSRI